MVTPDVPCEGESRGSVLPLSQKEQRGNVSGLKRKQISEEDERDVDLDAPRKTCGKHPDYRQMNDPFPDEEEDIFNDEGEQMSMLAANTEAHFGGDEPKSLKEVQWSPEWSEWEHAVEEELDQLHRKGAWILVSKPADAILIANKWVFMKKYGKDGDLLKYKGRLVVKGCTQRLGCDYTETFSPVMRLETLRIMLAMLVTDDLAMRQMDIKGAYLNGTLKEMVYMWQPEGYDDKSGRVCRLVKTLYGLKQSG